MIGLLLAALFGFLAVRWMREGVRGIRAGRRLSGSWVMGVGAVAGLFAVVIVTASLSSLGGGDRAASSSSAPSRHCQEAHRVADRYAHDANEQRQSASAADALNPNSFNYDSTRAMAWAHTVDLWANVVTNDSQCFSVRKVAQATDWLRNRP